MGLRTPRSSDVWPTPSVRADLLTGIADALDARDKAIVIDNARSGARRTPCTSRRMTMRGVVGTGRSATSPTLSRRRGAERALLPVVHES